MKSWFFSIARSSYTHSAILFILCIIVVVTRLFKPYHRSVAIVFLVLAWAILMHHVMKKKHFSYSKTFSVIFVKHAVLLSYIIVLFILLYLLYVLFPVNSFELTREESVMLDNTLSQDLEFLEQTLASANGTYQYLSSDRLLLLDENSFNTQDLSALQYTFTDFFSHILVFDRYVNEYKYFYQINPLTRNELHHKAFLVYYASFLAEYYYAFNLSSKVSDNIFVESYLDSYNENFGQKNLYSTLRFAIQSPNNLIRLQAARTYYARNRDKYELYPGITSFIDRTHASLYDQIPELGRQTIESNLDVFENTVVGAWLPFQKRAASLLTIRRLTTRDEFFISEDQVAQMVELQQPGDIVVQRRNWYPSNIAMPGFWTHSAMYLGTFDQLDQFFAEQTQEQYGVTFSQLVEDKFPTAYAIKKNANPPNRYIEAIAPGVVFLSAEESITADYIGVIRPSISKEDKLAAILYAFEQYGKPYDYNFDFATGDAFVCSELIYKAYGLRNDTQNLGFTLSERSGRPILAPNDIVKQFSEQYVKGTNTSSFVLFLDGSESSRSAVFKDADAFSKSWQRSKHAFFLE